MYDIFFYELYKNFFLFDVLIINLFFYDDGKFRNICVPFKSAAKYKKRFICGNDYFIGSVIIRNKIHLL